MSWSEFGVWLCAVVVHTTALSFNWKEDTLARAQTFETVFCWIGLVSALGVVIAPKRDESRQVCDSYGQSLACSSTLVCWSLARVLPPLEMRNWGPKLLAGFVLMACLASVAVPSSAHTRLGVAVCYLEFDLTHLAMAIVHATGAWFQWKRGGGEAMSMVCFGWCIGLVGLHLALPQAGLGFAYWNLFMLALGLVALFGNNEGEGGE
ncbi:hypothetical protein BASA81_010021 [Batrachochytrium salamandrivorans]|nr:hypothetical protein BASA81_010021 [Batrachochytrium salamandrivorans]